MNLFAHFVCPWRLSNGFFIHILLIFATKKIDQTVFWKMFLNLQFNADLLLYYSCCKFSSPLQPKLAFTRDHWCTKTNTTFWWWWHEFWFNWIIYSHSLCLIHHIIVRDPFSKAAFPRGTFGHMWSQHMFINRLRRMVVA